MFIKIHSPKMYGNSGSCNNLVEYLEKENEQKDLHEHQMFFDHKLNIVSDRTVVSRIDTNKAKLGKDEAKFYMLSINPSQDELKHICRNISNRNINSISELTKDEKMNYDSQIRDYTTKVMDKYAENFNRDLTGDDIKYFAKIEQERHFSRNDKLVQDGIEKAGDLKPGLQTHVHIIVSRKDMSNSIKLSPLANHKNSKNIIDGRKVQIGFDRKQFVKNCEKTFDESYKYNRYIEKSFDYNHAMKYEMRKLGRSFAASFLGDSKNIAYTAESLLKVKDPMDLLKVGMTLIPGSSIAIQASQVISNPIGLAASITKKILSKSIEISL